MWAGYLCTAGNAGQGITSNHETYLISADSADLADTWVEAIRRVMHEVCCHVYIDTAPMSMDCVTAIWWRDVWQESGRDHGS